MSGWTSTGTVPRHLPGRGLGAAADRRGSHGVVLLAVGFLACGISGCSGGGFGPSYSPGQARGALVVAAVVPVPLAFALLRGRRRAVRAAGTAAAAVVAGVLALVLTGLGPNGCPFGQSRAAAGPEAFEAGRTTCSGDRSLR